MKASAVKGPVGRSASAALFSSAAAACVLSALGILLWTSQCSEALQTPTPSLRIGPPQPDCSGGDMDAPTANPTTRASACNSEGEEPMTFSSWNSSSSSTSSSSSSSINREGFLRNAAGLGLGFAVGLSREPEPAYALFEDVQKPGRCPAYRAVPSFDVDKYMGIWYEVAYHDWTQIKICGCTRFNMTRTDYKIKDAFTSKCPYDSDLGDTFLINMRETVNLLTPGSFQEYAFYNKWDNKVVALWRGQDASGGAETYERAIQMQCVEVLGKRAFVGINFLSRIPIVASQVLEDMFAKARELGLASIGGNPAEMEIVRQKGCRYPSSTENTESRSWGSAWGVNILAL